METKVNEEYQNLINKLNEVIGVYKGTGNLNIHTLQEVKHGIEMLGTRPVLPDNIKQFIDITTKMANTYRAKNHDYGNSFEQSLDKFGLVASVVRIGDKMNRIESLTMKEAQVKDESIKDTLLDMANYAIMTVMWMDKKSGE